MDKYTNIDFTTANILYDGYDYYISLTCFIDKENTKKEYLRFSLVEDFKGLESNVVFYVHNITTPENYNYVAFTRAKYYLYELILKK